MNVTRRLLIGLATTGFVALGSAAWAQAPTQSRLRGTIQAVDGKSMTITTSGGERTVMAVADNVRVTWSVPIAMDAIKPGSFIGTAAMTQPDGTLKALEVHVFPEAMRGAGEGHRPWDLGPESTMTNGTVGDVTTANGRTLQLAYKGGEKTVNVPPGTPVITFEPATRAALTPGAHVIVTATQGEDGSLTAMRVNVGKEGSVPPM